MLIIIRDGDKELSQKTRFITELVKPLSNTKFLYVFRKDEEKFKEKWAHNKIELATSTKALLIYFFLIMLKSPRDLRDGLLRRLFHKKIENTFIKEGILSIISMAFYQYFGRSARTHRLTSSLRKINLPKIFLIDEFWSINSVRLKDLIDLGSIIYVSQDLAYNRFGYGDNLVTRVLMFKLERDFVIHANLVIASSEMERLKYLEMGAQKAIFYPNLYLSADFEPIGKDEMPSISIVLRGRWGPRGEKSLGKVFRALACLDRQIKVYMIGMKPKEVPKKVLLEHKTFIPSKLDYLKLLSKSWIGINVGIHKGGANERKYNYAEAGLVVFSDNLGARGDLLPYEYTYVDSHDLAAKINQLLEFGKTRIIEMGKENRNYTLNFAERKRMDLLREVSNLMS